MNRLYRLFYLLIVCCAEQFGRTRKRERVFVKRSSNPTT